MTFEPTLPALARSIAEWFPELGGRSIAVSEVEPFDNKTNVPTLPIAVTALVTQTGDAANGGATRIVLESDILVQFIYEPIRYQRQDGAQTPFFAFYDYEATRDRLIQGLRDWRTPRGGAVMFRALDVESDEFAVYLAFRLRASETWCAPRVPDDPCNPAPVVDVRACTFPSC